ncbi:class A beta-lactamase [Parasphingorhabdus sp.]|uniref:class A beta-lactamase n=1 Tax=Parasphingorhabdus sp. TaxID=2709688 RepID=UPI003D29264B
MLSTGLLLVSGCVAKSQSGDQGAPESALLGVSEIAEIEQNIGGRLGVGLIDGEGALILAHRGDERFALCSTFKAALASVLFAAHAAGTVDMFAKFALKPADRVPYMPFVDKKLAAKEPVSLHQLAGAAVMTSDNAAANLILKATGGPAEFTRFVRAQGDDVTRLDRIEPELNENAIGDPRDTTSPVAMARLIKKLALDDAALDIDKLTLQNWMKASKTGASRIRAGLPKGWPVGNKTGTAAGGIARNDIAIIWPATPEYAAKPVTLTVYVDRPMAPPEEVDAAMADVARIAARLISSSR